MKIFLLFLIVFSTFAHAECVGSDGSYYQSLSNGDLVGSNGVYLLYQPTSGNYISRDGILYLRGADGNLTGSHGVFLKCKWD